MTGATRTHDEQVYAAVTALDPPAIAALARLRRRAWTLLVITFVVMAPMLVIGMRFLAVQVFGEQVSARIVSRGTGGVVDPIVVTWDQGAERSVINVEDANEWCGPGPEDRGCERPVFVIDPLDGGHAAIQGELDVSPAAGVYLLAMLTGGLAVVVFAIKALTDLQECRRRRRILTSTTWRPAWLRVHGSRDRATRRGAMCSVALVADDEAWRPVRVKGRAKRLRPLLDQEQIEIAMPEPAGNVIVRVPGGEQLLDAVLQRPEAAPLTQALRSVGAGPWCDGETDAPTDTTLGLVGAEGDYDLFDADGVAAGEATGKFRSLSTSRFEVVDRDGAAMMTVTKRGTSWSAIRSDGIELTRANRRVTGTRFTFTAAPSSASRVATQAVRDGVRLQVVAVDGTPSKVQSVKRWTLQDDHGGTVAQVTFTRTATVIQLLGAAGDPASAALLAQCFIVAIGAVIPSNGG